MKTFIKNIISSVLLVLAFSLPLFGFETHDNDPATSLYALECTVDNLDNHLQLPLCGDPNWNIWNIDMLRTHPWLTNEAIKLYEATKGTLSEEMKREIIFGSIEEDYDAVGSSSDGTYNNLEKAELINSIFEFERPLNHFYAGVQNNKPELNNGGLTDMWNGEFSAREWAYDSPKNSYNFQAFCSNKKNYRAIGHILHLLEDMGSPAHVRNDAHPKKDSHEAHLAEQPFHSYETYSGKDLLITGSMYDLGHITYYFDDLSAATQENYFSDNTIMETEKDGMLLNNPGVTYFYETKACPNDASKQCEYPYLINTGDKAPNAKLARASVVELEKNKKNATKPKKFTIIDEECTTDLWKYHAPEIIRYAAGAIDYLLNLPDMDHDDIADECDPDDDGDSVLDINDNCAAAYNPDQANIDGDSLGDTCDSDADGDGYISVAYGGNDCNDSNPSIYPGAVEICGDGIIQDCNRSSDLSCNDVDNDGDGYTITQGDCNDYNSSIHPGAPEICGDGIDNNCNGQVDEGCILPDTWQSTSTTGAPSARFWNTAVWTGSEMIIWGGSSAYSSNYVLYNTGGKYDPISDTWLATSTMGAPSARAGHTAVWSGNEMIVWGGGNVNTPYLNTGGRYNPSTDSWISTSIAGAPSGRDSHSAIWNGNEMIIWGGSGGSNSALNTGGKYNPATDTWSDTSTVNAPSARANLAAVWTGTDMIVWGGWIPCYTGCTYFTNGGKYNPSTNEWQAISTTNAPVGTRQQGAVWTGTQMIVWGGANNSGYLNVGGKYDPVANSWGTISQTNIPSGRQAFAYAWTGTEMIVWGGTRGYDPYLNTGGIYNPASDSWRATTLTNAPAGRGYFPGIWTGSAMIIWGGLGGNNNNTTFNTGGRYTPYGVMPAPSDFWQPTSTTGAPKRSRHTAVWTGAEMIVWGGADDVGIFHNDGLRYDPVTDSWGSPLSTTGAPTARYGHTAVWSGSQMIIWGGAPYTNTGGKYNPSTDSWTSTTLTGALSSRYAHVAVWTGTEMIIWGGWDGGSFRNDGGRYNPVNDTWNSTLTTTGAPSGREAATAIWTGTEMIVWGGSSSGYYASSLNDGGRYNPSTNTWGTPVSATGAPATRAGHSAVWTGTDMIVWGGMQSDGGTYYADGYKYNPSLDTWSSNSLSLTNAPSARNFHSSVWTGTQMIIWGGYSKSGSTITYYTTGGRYAP